MNNKFKEYEEKLKQLRQNFVAQVPTRFKEIENQWMTIVSGDYNNDTIKELHLVVHSLAGSSGTFGYKTLMIKASAFDNWLKTLVNDGARFTEEQLSQIHFLIEDLCGTPLNPDDASIFATTQTLRNNQNDQEIRILIADDDDLASQEIKLLLERRGHKVMIVNERKKVYAATEEFNPSLIVMDMVFPDSDLGGAETIECLRNKGIDIPVIYMSVRDDMESRLSAIRSGAYHYITKPIDGEYFISLINSLISLSPPDPYRVLIVDDDPQLAEFYALMLRNAGMAVTTLNDPMHILDSIRDTRAELIMLDLYMPGCNGSEAATAIRQIEAFSNIPITFLSTEYRLDRQFIAMNHGGDDFLVKPVEPSHLIQAITFRVKRARVHREANENLKSAMQSISIAKNEADAANYAKSEFLSRMSHELRTPLNAILGFAQLLELRLIKQSNPGEDKELTQQILHAGWHLLELINEVLDMAKIEAGRINIKATPVSYQNIISETAKLVESAATTREIIIHNHVLDKSVPDVYADVMRLKQIVLNILSNAIKYNKRSGTITIDAKEESDSVTLSISDTGTGLSQEQMKCIFEPFTRVHEDGNTIEGTGLGLSISKRLIEIMQGSISATSIQGEGSTFSISLPKPPPGEILPAPGLSTTSEQVPAPPANRATRQKILYIEDNKSNIKLVSMLLAGSTDHILHIVETGQKALDLLTSFQPDLILLDINLPDIDGYTVYKHIREKAQFDHIPILALTANAMENDRKRAEEAGFDGYITKPINVKNFLDTINNALLVHSAQE